MPDSNKSELTIVITGSTAGVGFGMAQAALDLGLNVVTTGRRDLAYTRLIEGCKSAKGTHLHVIADIANADDVNAIASKTIAHFGSIDIWVNNAGFASTTDTIEQASQSDMETMIAVNFLGTINGCRAALSAMKPKGSGKIFNMLGGAWEGEFLPPLMGAYSATKAGVKRFTDYLISEEGEALVIGTMAPGYVVSENMIRQISKMPEAVQSQQMVMLNMMGDTPYDSGKFLLTDALKAEKSGIHIARMTPELAADRKAAAERGDMRTLITKEDLK